MEQQVVRYTTADGTQVRFEIDASEDYRPVGAAESIGRVREAMKPVVAAAHEIVADFKALRLDEVEVKFGIKVSGQANWLVARAATEGNFEVTLKWSSATDEGVAGAVDEAADEPETGPEPQPGAEPAGA